MSLWLLSQPHLQVATGGGGQSWRDQRDSKSRSARIPRKSASPSPKVYEGHLKNVGEASVKVRVCDAVSDAMQREIHVVHTIERWDSESQGWKELWRIPRQEFCRPYPTGIIEGRIVEVSLAPGQTVSTGEIAIQASDNLRLGDRLRFVVFPYSDGETVRLASPGFPVDERPSGRSRTDGGRQIEKRLTGPFR